MINKVYQIALKRNDPDLVDIETVKIDTGLAVEDRLRQYVGLIGNPYCYRSGDLVVNVEYSDKQTRIQGCVERIISNRIALQ